MQHAYTIFVRLFSLFTFFTLPFLGFFYGTDRSFAADTDIVINACWNNGYNHRLIQAARLDFELTVTNASVSEETIQAEIEKLKESTRKAAEKDPSFKPILEDILKNIPEGVRNRFAAEKKMKGSSMLNCGDSFGGVSQAKHELAFFDASTKKWSAPVVYLGGDVAGKQANAQWEPAINQANLLDVGASIASFQAFGRLDGPFFGEALMVLSKGKLPTSLESFDRESFVHKFGSAIRVTGKEQYDDGQAEAMAVEYAPGGVLRQRTWIDPSRGYICPKIQVFDVKTKKMTQEYLSKDYFLHKKSGLWYPATHAQSTFDKDSGNLLEKKPIP